LSFKAWELARRPRVVVEPDTPATVVRALMRDNEEGVAVVATEEGKVLGYITRREVIQITSHYSHLRAKDIMVSEPLIDVEEDLDKVFERLREHRLYGAAVVKGREARLEGVLTLSDIVLGLLKAGVEPIAETVEEVMTKEDIEKYVTYPDEGVNRVWADFVYHGVPGKVVLRSKEEPTPVGLITPKEFVETSRWFFHRESERGLKSIAKVKTIMIRGAPAATPETPISYVARIMAENEFTVLPVVDEEGKLVGVITLEDVVRAYLEGAKPGRVRPAKKAVLPVPVPAAQQLRYQQSGQLLVQVAKAKPAVTEYVGPRVRDYMREELPAISINDTVEHARNVMLRTGSNYILVIDEDGRIAGVVTKWSMLKAIALKGPIWKRRVHDRLFIDYVMERNIPKVPADASIEEAAYQLFNEKAELAYVVDEKGNIIGFITKDDLVKAYAEAKGASILVENVVMPGKTSIVHPHHSLAHVVKRMKMFYLDAVTVFDGSRIHGVVSANRLPFIALEDAVEGIKSRRLIWVRRITKAGPRKGRYVKVTPLLAIDATTPLDVTLTMTDTIYKAVKLMEEYNVDGIPVVDEKGAPIATICKNDIIRDMARTVEERLKKGLPVTVKAKE